MAGWHHGLDGRESEWTLGDGDEQGGLMCCDSWGFKESDMTERLNWTELNWTERWSWGCDCKILCWKTSEYPRRCLRIIHSNDSSSKKLKAIVRQQSQHKLKVEKSSSHKVVWVWFLSNELNPGLTVQFSHSVVSDSLWPHGLQHTRLPCPSPTPGACSNSCPSSWWCHPTISLRIFQFVVIHTVEEDSWDPLGLQGDQTSQS